MIYKAFLLFFVLEYVRPGTYLPIVNLLRLNSLVPLSVILGTAVTKGPVSTAEVLTEPNTKMLGVLLGMVVISVALVADVTLYGFEVFTTVLGYVLVYWVITMQLTDVERVKGLFKTLVGIHLLMAALTPKMFLEPEQRHYLSSGTFIGDGNDFALSVNVAIPFCLFLMFDARRKPQKVFWAFALLVLVLCVVATQSRGGTLALVGVGFYYWLKSSRKMVTGALALAAVIAVLLFAPARYFERMNTIQNYEEDGSAQGRITAWKAGARMAASNPIFGVGAGQFPSSYTRFAEGEAGRWHTAHSIYFLILAELGVPGLGLLLSFIFWNLASNRRMMNELRARSPNNTTALQLLPCLSASMIAYAIAGAFLSATYYPHMFIIGGLMVAGRRIARLGLGASEAPASAQPRPAMTFHPAMRRALNGRRAS